MITVAARLGLATLAVAGAVAALSQTSAAQGDTKPPGDVAAKLEKGRDLFANYGCGSCHSLGDAGATGHVGPSFDGNANLTRDFIINRVTNGQGSMPAFSGQMTPEEIADLASYLTQVAAK